MEDISQLATIYSLFNKVIFKEYRLNRDYFHKYINITPFLRENSLVTRLIDIIDNYEYEDITDDTLNLVLLQDKKTFDEIKDIVSKINSAKDFNKEDLSRYKDHFKDCCCKGYIDSIKSLQAYPSKYMEELTKFNYLSDHSDKLFYKVFSELDFASLDEELNQSGVKSTFDFINESYANGMYPYGQIVLVCAAPSTGKSLFLEQEAVTFCQQGVNTHMIVMGDLNEARLAVRLVSLALNIPLSEVTRNLKYYSDKVGQMFRDHLRITVVPSSVVNIDEYIEFALGYLKDCQVLMIDYDKNFAPETDNMYEQGRSLYDRLTKLSQQGKLVFVASQPKIQYYKEEHLGMDAPAESSGKMQVVDMQIHIGRNPNSKLRMGYFDIPKNRNGEPNASAAWIGCNDGSFFIVDEMLYMKYYKEQNKKLQFSRFELEAQMEINELDKQDNMTATFES